MYEIYKTLIDVYKRQKRDMKQLSLRIGAAFAVGQLSDEEYAELILLCNS